MRKAVLVQSPAYLYEVVPIFYKELNRLGYFDTFYLATDQSNTYGLGNNVQVIPLKYDLGRARNFLKALEVIKEDVFVMMCDDHVIRQDHLNLDSYYEIMQADASLGRLQLSPPTNNYLRYLRKRYGRDLPLNYAKPYGIYPRDYRWHVNFQPSLWRKDFFTYCLQGGENRNKLEIRAATRAKRHSFYRSGYIFEHAVQVDNFYASCKVHTADPHYDRMKNAPHYREEFVRYAVKHNITLKPERSVFVKRAGFVASVPQTDYLRSMNDEQALRQWAVRSTPLRSWYAKVADHVKLSIGV